MNEVFSIKANSYNKWQFNVFETQIRTSNRYGLKSILYKANQLWNLLPEYLKSSPSLTLFKKEIKLLEWFNSPCNIFKSFVPNIAYSILGKHFSPAFSPILGTGFGSCLGRILITEPMLLYVSILCKGAVLSKLY